MLIFHINPLNIFPVCTWSILDVGKFVFKVRSPSDVCLFDVDLSAAAVLEDEGVVEHALGDESAGNSRVLVRQDLAAKTLFLVFPQISDRDDGIAVAEFFDWFEGSTQLGPVSRFNVASMVLQVVVDLIVNVDRPLNITFDFLNVNVARSGLSTILRLQMFLADLIILSGAFKNLAAHQEEHAADGEEENTEQAEGDNGTLARWLRPPRAKGLLLEP